MKSSNDGRIVKKKVFIVGKVQNIPSGREDFLRGWKVEREELKKRKGKWKFQNIYAHAEDFCIRWKRKEMFLKKGHVKKELKWRKGKFE